MGGQTGQQIGGQGDEASSAGHRIHDAAEKDQGTDNE